MKQKIYEDVTPVYFIEVLKEISPKKIFVVCGKDSFYKSGSSDFIESSLKPNFEFSIFNDFNVNPNFDDIIKGTKQFIRENCDLIVAIGGGSTIDMAKSINVFQANNKFDLTELVKSNKIAKVGVPLIAIPTTAGSGSESTKFAVIYLDSVKYSIDHEKILPEIVFLNSGFLLSQTRYLRTVSGLDALCQAIESYWSVNSTVKSKVYAKEAIKLLIGNLESSITEPSLITSAIILRASNLAGKAINISKTTAPHAISYFLTSNYGIPHGQAVFLTLPHIFEFNYSVSSGDSNDERGVKYVKKSLEEICQLLNVKTVNDAKLLLLNLGKNLGIEMSFNKLGISLDGLYEKINFERVKNNPRKITKELIKSIFNT